MSLVVNGIFVVNPIPSEVWPASSVVTELTFSRMGFKTWTFKLKEERKNDKLNAILQINFAICYIRMGSKMSWVEVSMVESVTIGLVIVTPTSLFKSTTWTFKLGEVKENDGLNAIVQIIFVICYIRMGSRMSVVVSIAGADPTSWWSLLDGTNSIGKR